MFNHLIVNCLLAYACFLRAVPIINVNQHLLNEPRALLISAAISSSPNHILETDSSWLVFALSFYLFQLLELRSFLSRCICFRVEFISRKAAGPLV